MNDHESHKRPSSKPAMTVVSELFQAEKNKWEAQGRDAWSRLEQLGSNNLPRGDEVALARKLHEEFPHLKQQLKERGVGLGDLCLSAGLGTDGDYSKELHRMMLPPDKDAAKVRLRRSASKYRSLIAAMAKASGQSSSSLANRLMVGTSLHPATAEVRDEIEGVQIALQAIVDAVDQEFGLLRTFLETAELKARYARAGSKCRWPQHDADHRVDVATLIGLDVSARKFKKMRAAHEGVAAEEPDEEFDQMIRDDEDAASLAELELAMDTTKAYWEPTLDGGAADAFLGGPAVSGCIQDDEFFYVPHAYIGDGLGIWDPVGEKTAPAVRDRTIAELRERVLEGFKQYGPRPVDGWDEAAQMPRGQTTSGQLGNNWACWHAWLVAYPAPDNGRLIPMLYVAAEEGGPILVVLDLVTLSSLRQTYWIGPAGEVATFFERIKNLIGLRPGEPQAILDGLRATAPWLRWNPFMKMEVKRTEDLALLQKFCGDLTNRFPGKK